VFLVSVRFAYGFLDFLFTYNLHQLCPFAPLPLQELHHYYGLMPHGFASHFLPARRGRHLTYINGIDVPSMVPLFPML